MYLLKFKIGDKKFLLHDGESFIGAESEAVARQRCLENSAKAISAGGFDVVEMSVEELSKAIGGVPYKILQITGGLIPFIGVEIIKEKE